MRALALDVLQEKMLATHAQELTCLAQHLQPIEAELAKRKLDYESTRDLFRLAALLRSEIRKARLEPDSALAELAPASATALS